MMELDRIGVDCIEVGATRRKIDDARVKALAESIKTIGLQTPITVWLEPDGEDFTPHLIVGRHRVEAYKQLGEDYIDAFIMEADDIDRQLWEIDENLCRAELTDLERANHTARRAELLRQRALLAKSAKKVGHRPNQGQATFDKQTAAATGRSERSVRDDKRRGEKIADDVKESIADTPAADKGVELDALASMKPDDQREAVKMVEAGSASDFRDAKMFIDGVDPDEERIEKAVTRLYKAFVKVDQATRNAYMAKLYETGFIPEWLKATKKGRP